MVDSAVLDAGAVIGGAFLGLYGSVMAVRQARSAQRSAEAESTRERERRDDAEQRKLDQTAFDRFERHNRMVIEQLTQKLDQCQELTGVAIGYSQALHSHVLNLHAELSRNKIPVPAAPQVPDQLARLPWVPWRNGATPNDAVEL